ncbi:MAG: hypothetical protein HS116_05765 [Planctomycetes bacterium]|nr:hypothetical protein [Planctomycetota bacterium]
MATSEERRRIAIEGGLVRLERTVIEREARTEDFLAEIARMQPVDTGVLPEGCVLMARRFDAQKRSSSLFVIERAPGMQRILFNGDPGAEADEDDSGEPPEAVALNLSWPRTLWICRTNQAAAEAATVVTDLWVVAVKTSVRETERNTPIFCLPMPNIYHEGHGPICMGNITTGDCATPLADRIDAAVHGVLDSAWNSDLMPEFESLEIASLADWAEKSAADPAFHRQITYRPHRQASLGGLLQHLAPSP